MHVKNMYQGHLKILYNKRNLFFYLFYLFTLETYFIRINILFIIYIFIYKLLNEI